MGGLGKYMPSTNITFLISTLAIAGIPLLSGFFSKDEILFYAFERGINGHPYAFVVWGIGVVTALLTAFYMTRCYVLTFRGRERWPRADEIHPHESPATMTIPLWVLGGLAVVGGLLGLPPVIYEPLGLQNYMHYYLGAPYGGPVAEPEMHGHVSHAVEWGLLGLGALIAVLGVAVAWFLYDRRGLAFDEGLRRRLGGLYRIWQRKYYWDELYREAVVEPVVGGSREVLAPFDLRVVDGAVNGLARAMRGLGGTLRYVQTGIVQNYALAIVLGVAVIIALMIFG